MIPANGVKNSASDARYPISQRPVPRPAVSLIHCIIQVVFAVSHSCALRWTTVYQDPVLVKELSKKIQSLPASIPHLHIVQPDMHPVARRQGRPKSLSCWYNRDWIVCVKALPARMTAWLPHRIPGHGAGICTGPISGSTMHNAGSTPSRSGGGARVATRLRMICGKNSSGFLLYHWSERTLSPHYPSPCSPVIPSEGQNRDSGP